MQLHVVLQVDPRWQSQPGIVFERPWNPFHHSIGQSLHKKQGGALGLPEVLIRLKGKPECHIMSCRSTQQLLGYSTENHRCHGGRHHPGTMNDCTKFDWQSILQLLRFFCVDQSVGLTYSLTNITIPRIRPIMRL